ncbi:MAG: NUDIX domain-containing protein [Fimbriiglobus sp.]
MSFIPDDLYRRIVEHVPIACVDIVILADRAALLVRRQDPPAAGQWWVPGGRVLKGEVQRDTAARKAREEVGLDCHVGALVHTAETIFPDGPYGLTIHSINSCFVLTPKAADFRPTLDARQAEYRWVREVPAGLHPYVAACLTAAGLRPEPTGDPQW